MKSVEAKQASSMEAEFRVATAQIVLQIGAGIDTMRRLSARGYSPASYELGNCLYTGNMIEKNHAKALAKWREASVSGHAFAKINVIRYEWFHAGIAKKTKLSISAIGVILWVVWLGLMNDGHETRLIGSRNPDLTL